MKAKTNSMRVKKILVRLKHILMYLRINMAHNLTLNVELANGNLDIDVDKLDEVQKYVRDLVISSCRSAGRRRGSVGGRRRRKRAR